MHARSCAVAFVAFVIAAPLPAQAQAPAQVVQLANFSFTPRIIYLKAGQPVTLNFVNSASGGHDFTAAQFFASSRITAGSAPDGAVELRGHESRSVTLVPRAGTYKAYCSHFMHKQFGMTGQIVVR